MHKEITAGVAERASDEGYNPFKILVLEASSLSLSERWTRTDIKAFVEVVHFYLHNQPANATFAPTFAFGTAPEPTESILRPGWRNR